MNPIQMMQMVQQLKGNVGRLGVPQNIANDPQAIIQHLMNTGRISQDQYNKAMQTAKNMGFRP